jgi:peptidoglycan/xylan/chitin deacetylase (PgdA/CDA1 family)
LPPVFNVLTQPDGTPIENAVVEIRLIANTTTQRGEGFVTSTQESILWRKHVSTDADGRWEANLQPNSEITPDGTVYLIAEDPPGRAKAEEHYISVPDTAGPHWLYDILTEAPASLASSALELHRDSVKDHDDWSDSAPSAGQVPIWNGSAYVPGDTVATDIEAAALVTAHNADTTDVHGIPDTSALATDAEVASAVSDHSADTTGVHGIADTAALLTQSAGDTRYVNETDHTLAAHDALGLATDTELSAHLTDTTAAHAASAISVTPTGGLAADDVQEALSDLQAGSTYTHRMLDSGADEPGAFICWTADDGYGTEATGFFPMLNTQGVDGTLFLSTDYIDRVGTDPTYGDSYITSAQLNAIIAAGHEIGTHGQNHENYNSQLTALGADGFEAFLQESIDIIEGFGTTVRTGAYCGGVASERVRELVARNHEFYRGSKGIVGRGAPDPFLVPSIDCQFLSEAAIKAHIDTAIANRSVVVFLVHGGLTAGQLTNISNAIDYAQGLGVPMGTFYDAMRQRTVVRGTRTMIDARGFGFFPTVRGHRFEFINPRDQGGDYSFLSIDETTGNPYWDSSAAETFEFRGLVSFLDDVTFADQVNFDGVVLFKKIENLIQSTAYASETEVLFRVKRSAAAGTDAGSNLFRIDQRGHVFLGGAAAQLRLFNSAAAETGRWNANGEMRVWESAALKIVSFTGSTAITAPTGGTIIDVEARAAIASLLTALGSPYKLMRVPV